MYKLIDKLYEFNWLTFCIKVVPRIFHQIMHAMLGDLDFAGEYLENILIKSRNRKEHAGGGARGVIVSVVGNGHGDTSSNPERD